MYIADIDTKVGIVKSKWAMNMWYFNFIEKGGSQFTSGG